uniref:Uncharacterized protein n=1 Tax=Tetranychus urticae TaxID=32264 RepID=T1JSS2_TETUR
MKQNHCLKWPLKVEDEFRRDRTGIPEVALFVLDVPVEARENQIFINRFIIF